MLKVDLCKTKENHMKVFFSAKAPLKLKGLTTNLPFKLAVGPVPVSANGGGDITAYAALWKEV